MQSLGRDPVVMNKAAEEDRLHEWAQKGYRGMTLVHVGAHAALAPVSAETVKELARRIKSKNPDVLERSPGEGRQDRVSGSNYLSAAIGLGLIREIYWVIPYQFFGSAGGGEQAREFLVDRGLVKDRSEADRFRLAGGCLAGSIRNAEITICAPDTMHLIREPVLLDLDMDFFRAFAQGRGINLLEGFKIFMDAMFSRGYMVAGAYITSPPVEEPFDPALAYVGPQVQEALKNPSIMQQADPSPLWKARDEGDALLRGRDFQRAYVVLKNSIKEFGPDKGLRALLACAALQRGKYEEALTEASDLCKETKADCGLLVYLGGVASDEGRPERASVFFQKALEVIPGWKLAEERLEESKSRDKKKEVRHKP